MSTITAPVQKDNKAAKSKVKPDQVAPVQPSPEAKPEAQQGESPKPEAKEPTPKEALLAKVKKAIADCASRTPAEMRAILTAAMGEVTATCPNVTLSENKEQRAAQMDALRKQRAELGWQVCARLIGDAIAAIPGADVTFHYQAKPLANGSLVAVEKKTVKTKAPKGSGKRALVIQ
jgi:hypothetical protein